MTTFPIQVVIDPSRAKSGRAAIAAELDGLERRGKQVGDTLRSAFLGVGAVFVAKKIIDYADGYVYLENRIRAADRATGDVSERIAQLHKISTDTLTPLRSTAIVYSRLALASRDIGISAADALKFTESLNNAVRVGGSTAAESTNAMIQLSQGIAAGALRGDELRSVLEQMPVVSRILADELGVTVGQLRELGKAGAITTDVIRDGLIGASEDLRKQAAALPPTIGQAFTQLSDSVGIYIGETSKATGAGEAFAGSLLFLAENTKTLANSTIVLGAAYGGLKLGAYLQAALNATKATSLLSAAQILLGNATVATTVKVRAFTAALASNPVTLALVGISALVAAFILLGDETEKVVATEEKLTFKNLANEYEIRAKAINRTAKETDKLNAIEKASERLGRALTDGEKIHIRAQEDLIAKLQEKKTLEDEGVELATKTEKKLNETTRGVQALDAAQAAGLITAEQYAKGFADVHGGLEDFDEVLKSLGDQVEAKFLGQTQAAVAKLARTYEEAGRAVPTEKLDEASFLFGILNQKASKSKETFASLLKELDSTNQRLAHTARLTRELNTVNQFEETLKKSLTAAQRELVVALTDEAEALERIKPFLEAQTTQTAKFEQARRNLTNAFIAGRVTLTEYDTGLRNIE